MVDICEAAWIELITEGACKKRMLKIENSHSRPHRAMAHGLDAAVELQHSSILLVPLLHLLDARQFRRRSLFVRRKMHGACAGHVATMIRWSAMIHCRRRLIFVMIGVSRRVWSGVLLRIIATRRRIRVRCVGPWRHVGRNVAVARKMAGMDFVRAALPRIPHQLIGTQAIVVDGGGRGVGRRRGVYRKRRRRRRMGRAILKELRLEIFSQKFAFTQ